MSDYLSLSVKDLTTKDLHGYLLTAIAPRPIAFVSTIDKAGQVNLSPFSFFNVFSSNPPVAIFSPSRRVRNNTTKHTLENVLEVKECVINIVNYPIVQQVSLASTEYAKGVNEFIKSGLTEIKSELVQAPRVAESPVALECKVMEVKSLGDQGGAGNLVICEVLKIHIQKSVLNKEGKLDTTKLDLAGRMGEHWYIRAVQESLFSIPKPLSSIGIGIDNLPEEIRLSNILTGNDLAKLATIENLPSAAGFNADKSNHKSAKQLLEENKIEEAWELLSKK